MYLPMFNPMYYLFALPALLLGLYAQYKVRSTYNKFGQVANQSGMSGLQVAQRLLQLKGLYDVDVSETGGQLTDHYDPRSKRLVLSTGVARSSSVSSLGMFAHEVGHAVQDHEAYLPLQLR